MSQHRSIAFISIPIVIISWLSQSTSAQQIYDSRYSPGVPPRILEHPQEREILSGGTTYLSCRSSSPAARVTWYRDGRPLVPGVRQNAKVLHDGTLVITGVNKNNEGMYRCTARNQAGSVQSREARLSLFKKVDKPKIRHRPVYTEVSTGDLIVLDCGAIGFPVPTFSWYKDGGRLSPAHDRFSLAGNGSLIISNAQLDDSAHYRCSASNYLGKASSAARVKVNTRDPPARPVITSQPRSRVVNEGAIVELTCVARGSPYPDTTWWNNNRIVANNARVSVSNGGQHLRIQDIEVYDQGHYTCRAENNQGRTELTATISVIGHRQSNLAIVDQPHLMEATMGSTVQLPCKVSGEPRPVISWEKDGSLMAPGDRHRFSSDGSLYVYNVTMEDAGSYMCVANNGRERRTATTRFSVLHDRYEHRTTTLPPSLNRHSTTLSRFNSIVSRTTPAPSATRVPSFNGHTGHPPFSQSLSSQLSPPIVDTPPPPSSISHHLLPSQLSALTFNQVESEPTDFFESNHESDLSYDVSGPGVGDQFVVVSIEEATRTVDRALNNTVQALFENYQHSNKTPHQLLNVFRYPSADDRQLARAAEIYQRTLELVEAKVREGGDYNLTEFRAKDLISPANLELIGNISGCESHRRESDCDDICFHAKYRSVDGSCNNLINTLWGASLTAFARILPPQYENGFNTPIGYNSDRLYFGFKKPSARLVSSRLLSSHNISYDVELSHMTMQWGQFIDHDIDHSMEAVSRETFNSGQTCSATCTNDPPCFPIPVPQSDPRISNHRCMEFTRSSASCGSGATSVFFEQLQQREQINQISSYIDASQVYGSRFDLATSLRNLTNDYGRLREGVMYDYGKPLLPFNDGQPIDCRRDPRSSSIGCFLAGDLRTNEQLGLLSMHTVWFREHNRVAGELRNINPHWDGDRIYQESRKVIWSSMQHITLSHWLPKIIGPQGMEKLGPYKGYNPNIDASIANVFATSAFRFGHSLISPVMRRLNDNFTSIPEGDLPLHHAFFAPWRLVEEGGLDPLLRGLFASPAKMVKTGQFMNKHLTERLFEVAHSVALDLAALNIQRGRDHGLASYTQWREHCGFGKTETFADLAGHIKSKAVLQGLEELYGHPGNVDLFVGSSVEDIVEGGRVGPTTQCLIIQQFRKLRDGDRFWYENPAVLRPDQITQLKQVTLGRVVCDNSDDIRDITEDVFTLPENAKLKLRSCLKIPQMSLRPWTDCQEEEEIEVFPERVRRSSPMEPRQESTNKHIIHDRPKPADNEHKPQTNKHQVKFDKQNLEMSQNGTNSKSSSTQFIMLRTVHLLRTVRHLKRRLSKLEAAIDDRDKPRKLSKLEAVLDDRDKPRKKGTMVCLDYTGKVRMEGELWIHQQKMEDCVHCQCKKHQITCSLQRCL